VLSEPAFGVPSEKHRSSGKQQIYIYIYTTTTLEHNMNLCSTSMDHATTNYMLSCVLVLSCCLLLSSVVSAIVRQSHMRMCFYVWLHVVCIHIQIHVYELWYTTSILLVHYQYTTHILFCSKSRGVCKGKCVQHRYVIPTRDACAQLASYT
jgi:hypothetical protein